jgi:hypothetical protein
MITYEWSPAETPPECVKGHNKTVILAVELANKNKIVQSAVWMNQYPIHMEEDVFKEYGPYDDSDGIRYVTGFFEPTTSYEYEVAYKPVDGTPLYWTHFPPPPEGPTNRGPNE